jgi:hypothetical protein
MEAERARVVEREWLNECEGHEAIGKRGYRGERGKSIRGKSSCSRKLDTSAIARQHVISYMSNRPIRVGQLDL